MKQLSAGILVLHDAAALLMAHATGARHWDIPKGLVDDGESPLDAALREASEECGLAFGRGDLLDLGRYPYRPAKDLHLFATLAPQVDPAQCRCTSFFRDRFGRLVPEADAFEWVPFARLPERCAKSMFTLLDTRLALPDLLARLRTKAPPA